MNIGSVDEILSKVNGYKGRNGRFAFFSVTEPGEDGEPQIDIVDLMKPTMKLFAMDYARRGFEVFPCVPGKNSPYTPKGVNDASSDPAVVAAWWDRWPDAVIGWRIPDGYVAVDVDQHADKETGEVIDGWATLREAGIEMPDTPFAARSGGGGDHLIYMVPPREMAKTAAPINGLAGVDTRAHAGGYIIIAPSIHKSGNRYAWADTVDQSADLWTLLGGCPAAPLGVLYNFRDKARRTYKPSGELTEELKAAWRDALKHVDADDRENWTVVARGLKLEFGDEAFELFDEYSARSKKYRGPDDCRKTWDSFNRADGTTFRHILKLARDGGWRGELPDAFTRERKARATRRGKGDNGGGSFTQVNAAERFRDEYQDRFKHCTALGGWQWWNGACWEHGDAKAPVRAMKELVVRVNVEEKGGDAGKNQTAHFIKEALFLASAEDGIAVTQDDFDRDPFLLATPGGTVDLRDGVLRPADPADLITRCTTATPAATADCPLWKAFLAFALRGDAELIRFVQQWAGYALTGETREHVFAFFYGGGGNGKGTFLNSILAIMGSYGKQINAATLMSGASERHLTEVASLRGARFVVAPEVTAGKEWDEERIKTMTGGDKLRARFMHQDEFEFMPEFKITISGNHQPILRNVDDAMRRRLRIVPLTRKPAVVDRELSKKLEAEYPGILRWMIDGALDWQQNGLILPAAVETATASYFEAQDVFGEWASECCEIDPERPDWFTPTDDLLASYNAFRNESGEKPTTGRLLADPLKHAGAAPHRPKDENGRKQRGYRFIRLTKDPDAGLPGN